MMQGGTIKRVSHVSFNDVYEFYKGLRDQIDRMPDSLDVEIQYQTTMQPDGRALFSALILGRTRADE